MNYYDEIKTKLINNEFTKKVKDYSKNKSDLNTYYYVGKMLSEAGKHYGEGIIKEYSIKLSCELNIKYTPRTLRRMRQFYLFYIDEKWSTMSTKLTYFINEKVYILLRKLVTVSQHLSHGHSIVLFSCLKGANILKLFYR